jgi:hypothetical protein
VFGLTVCPHRQLTANLDYSARRIGISRKALVEDRVLCIRKIVRRIKSPRTSRRLDFKFSEIAEYQQIAKPPAQAFRRGMPNCCGYSFARSLLAPKDLLSISHTEPRSRLLISTSN